MTTPLVTAVIPFRNAADYLRRTAPTLLAAATRHGRTEVIYVDNGSTDDSLAFLRSLASPVLSVVTKTGGTIAAVRNFGAEHARGSYLAFLDADCTIGPDYFDNAIRAIESSGSAATGCEVSLPPDPDWIEHVWDSLHYVGRDRQVHYLNSANFFIRRSTFLDVGGFDETLITGEDSEIGARLRQAGHRILESTSVTAVHWGNPKSISGFFRRNVWHSVGMLASQRGVRLDKPTAMLGAHLLLSLGWLALLVGRTLTAAPLLGLLALSQVAVPAATVAFRQSQVRRRIRILPAIFLYWLYYWARAYGLILIALGRDAAFRK